MKGKQQSGEQTLALVRKFFEIKDLIPHTMSDPRLMRHAYKAHTGKDPGIEWEQESYLRFIKDKEVSAEVIACLPKSPIQPSGAQA